MTASGCGDALAGVEGRELDALVAERVMGWENVAKLPMYSLGENGEGEATLEADGFEWRGDVLGFERTVPQYSTGIFSAWLVVEAMAKRGFHARLKTPFTPDDPYFAGFTPHGSTGWSGRGDYEASGETLPLAICLAALQYATYWPELPPFHAEGVTKVLPDTTLGAATTRITELESLLSQQDESLRALRGALERIATRECDIIAPFSCAACIARGALALDDYHRELPSEVPQFTSEEVEAVHDALDQLHGPKMDGPRNATERGLLSLGEKLDAMKKNLPPSSYGTP